MASFFIDGPCQESDLTEPHEFVIPFGDATGAGPQLCRLPLSGRLPPLKQE